MPSETERIGLALSGGGYRATAFHLGTLKKLHDLNILEKIDVMSTISGGSITGAYYCAEQGNFDAVYAELYSALQTKDVVKKVLFSWLGLRLLIFIVVLIFSLYWLFTPFAWLFPVILVLLFFIILRYQFMLLPISKRIEQVYDQFFYHKKKLAELPEKPKLIIGSTNLQTARPFSFSRSTMWDTSYGSKANPMFKNDGFPLSRAVMASSCVPFAFTPVTIAKEYFRNPADAEKIHPLLVDGGVYDNQGIHKIMQDNRDLNIIITSDAGGGSKGEITTKNTFTLLTETVNVFMARIKKSQMVTDVYDNADTFKKEIAYFSLAWDMENCIPGFIDNLEKKQITEAVITAQRLKEDWVSHPRKYAVEIEDHLKKNVNYDSIPKPTPEEKKIARGVGTNLTALKKEEVDCLIKQALALTEIQVKLYCPSLFRNH